MQSELAEGDSTEDPITVEYRPYILKRYQDWTLLLHPSQRYLGRAVIWLHRPGDMQRFSLLTIGELIELQRICHEYEMVLARVGWDPDHINYAMLGNFFHEHKGHGHMHLIPRYTSLAKTVSIMGVSFNDDRWGKNYAPETPRDIPDCVLGAIVALLRKQFDEEER